MNLRNEAREHAVDQHLSEFASGNRNQPLIKECLERYGWTALCFAAANNHIDVVKALLESGASTMYATNKQTFFESALEVARKKKHLEVVDFLRKAENRAFSGSTNTQE